MDKPRFRKEARKILSQIPESEIKSRSEKIAKNFAKFVSPKHKVFAVYLSLPKEVQTDMIISLLRKNGKTVLVPFITGEVLKFSKLYECTKLEKNDYCIREPVKKQTYSGEIDVVVIPGLAFDRYGKRLGRGKGYYDRFLKTSCAIRLGICFESQLFEEIPSDNNDAGMDCIMTEKEVISFGNKI